MTSEHGIVSDERDIAGEIVRVRDISETSGRDRLVDVELLLAGQRVSSCQIFPMSLRVGSAVVRMDGIGDVKTNEEYRHRGFARRVLSTALEHMEAGDAALTMLYGITDFYPKFGYITVGPESAITLPPLQKEGSLPGEYQTRPFQAADLPSLQRLYERATAGSVATAVRPRQGYPWSALLDTLREGTSDDCRVLTDAEGEVTAYVWRGEPLSFVWAHSRYNPEDLILAEVVAADPRSADAALTVCRWWAAEESDRRGRDVRQARFFMPYDGPVAAAAMQMPATFSSGYDSDGGWMARVLSTRRLFSSLQPELSRRLAEAHSHFRGALHIVTEAGEVILHIDGDGLRVEDQPLDSRDRGSTPSDGEILTCLLPQTTLARLALGAFPPGDLLARLPDPPEEGVADLLRMMFPQRPAQLFLADRF